MPVLSSHCPLAIALPGAGDARVISHANQCQPPWCPTGTLVPYLPPRTLALAGGFAMAEIYCRSGLRRPAPCSLPPFLCSGGAPQADTRVNACCRFWSWPCPGAVSGTPGSFWRGVGGAVAHGLRCGLHGQPSQVAKTHKAMCRRVSAAGFAVSATYGTWQCAWCLYVIASIHSGQLLRYIRPAQLINPQIATARSACRYKKPVVPYRA